MKKFESIEAYATFIKRKKCINIGEGSEGECFLSSEDGKVYKIFYDFNSAIKVQDPSVLITKDDLVLSSYNFPRELFFVGDKLCGYSADYIANDLFDCNTLLEGSFMDNIDIDALKEAYLKMKLETIALSREHIEAFDMTYNLIFTGKKLVAIDTLGYRKVKESPLYSNLEQLDNALVNALFFFLEFDGVRLPKRRGMAMEKYLDLVKEIIKKEKVKKYE